MTTTAKIWDQFHDNLYAFVLKRVRNEADTDDILQDVFIRIHQSLDKLKDEKKLESWVFQIARNATNDFFRKQSKLSGEEFPELEDQDVGFYGKQEMFCCLQPFVKELPEKYRMAIELADLQGKKQGEVAKILGISHSGAKSRVQRGREILKEKFVECCHFTIDENGKLTGEQDCERCHPTH